MHKSDFFIKRLEDIIEIIASKFKKIDDNSNPCGVRTKHEENFRNDMQLYKEGMNGFIPSKYKKQIESAMIDIAKIEDPEYQDYLRLQKKFEVEK